MRRARAAIGPSALAVALALVLAAGGCGGGESGGASSPTAEAAQAARAGAAESFLASVQGTRVLVAAFHPL